MKRPAKSPQSPFSASLAAAGFCFLFATAPAGAQEYLPGIKWEKPPVVTPGKTDSDPPSDAIVLFGGKNLDKWKGGEKWKIEDGVAVVHAGTIETKQTFGDCQLHIEWSSPKPAKGSGQGRGNSGVFFGPYEFQVLDSYNSETYREGQAASVYKQTPPWVNAMRPPGEWNAYDIIWTAPKFKKDGSLKSPAYLTALHNGVLVQNHFELLGTTDYISVPHYDDHGKLPIRLQDHGNPVRFRNIWIREIKAPVGKRVHPPSFRFGDKLVPVEKAKAEVGDDATVAGRVSLDGEVLTKGKIIFVDENQSAVEAKIHHDGGYGSTPLKSGSYTVYVFGNSDVPSQFQSAETSGMKATIQPGANTLDFGLSNK